MNVGNVCTYKPIVGWREDTIVDAARRMREHHVGDLVIVDGSDPDHYRVVGMLTDRDITVGVVADAPESFTALVVGDILPDADPVVIKEDVDVLEAMARMRRESIRRLPVVNPEGYLIGIFTLDDAVALLAEHLVALGDLSYSQRSREREKRR